MKTYQNPIRKGMYPDPSIVRVEDVYYMVNSTFEYFPGISLAKSKDLINWQPLPSVVNKKSQANLSEAHSNEGIFAVCIRYHEGYFYVITTNFAEWKNFIIRGKLDQQKDQIIWEDSRMIIDIMGIDPDLYFEDNQTYVQFTGFTSNGQKAIQQVQIDLETGNILRGPEVLSFGTGGRDVEGPHIIKKANTYYLLMAEGGTGAGHMVTMQKSNHLWGPYEAEFGVNPLFTNRDRAEEPLQNIGHADLFQDTSDNWWLVCLGTRPYRHEHIQFTNLGRETLLYPVIWEDVWPKIYDGTPSLTVDLSQFPNHEQTIGKLIGNDSWEDNFSQLQINQEWLSLRNSLANRLSIGFGRLSLRGSDIPLSAEATPSFLAIRQTEYNQLFRVEIDSKQSKLEEKDGAYGVACYIDTSHFAAIMVQKLGNEYVFYRQQKVLDLEINQVLARFSTGPISFEIQNKGIEKIFSAHLITGETIQFATSAIHFSNEAICALNTGDMLGIYVIGENSILTITNAKKM